MFTRANFLLILYWKLTKISIFFSLKNFCDQSFETF